MEGIDVHMQEGLSPSSDNSNDFYLMGILTNCLLIYGRPVQEVCVSVSQRKLKTTISQTPRTELVIQSHKNNKQTKYLIDIH